MWLLSIDNMWSRSRGINGENFFLVKFYLETSKLRDTGDLGFLLKHFFLNNWNILLIISLRKETDKEI